MHQRPDPRHVTVNFNSVVGTPPFSASPIRARKGLKRTAFFDLVWARAENFKLHNTYLKPDFFTDPLEEYHAIRETAGLLDVTGEEIIEITGPDAIALLDAIMPRDVRKMKDGMCYYSVLCHDHGGIVEDGIVAKFSDERLWWIGGPGSAEEWIWANAQGRDVKVESFNDRIHVASIQGPKSREILQSVTEGDLAAVPFYGLLSAKVCGVDVVISRTGYTAELGYDIYVPVAPAAQFFADLWAVTEAAGGKLAGSRSLGIRRIEASILNFGQDFDWQHNPVEVGLGWMISESKAPWRAGEVLLAAKHQTPKRSIIGLRFKGEEVPLTEDAVLVDGAQIGIVTSALGSPTLGYPIAIALIEGTLSFGTEVTVQAGENALLAEVVPMPFFDPERKLSKG
ncbi:aminomethyltransferase family protein [Paracoccus aminophilus]|uniref:Glycine cleavage system T protein (Aminomethyltransferase) n=1 Tax=Paracoccus aminophilus JCM 7686 TaxID=1367847 RepID=S5YZP1_PARAH|nr:aminomethyltransferase family protein [Paracoccus aminophilus]AGT10676.1 glycine cleavage system T protein (aminomethyltransferase) [Paracoccus aminophilus JCM 7686]